MLLALLAIMGLNSLLACASSPTFQKEYRGNYVPDFVKTEFGYQIVAPETPYVAVAGLRQLYFIDTRFRPETAAHIKEQIERASVGEGDEYTKIDEIEATAEVRSRTTGETIFVFDPPYARVLFAAGINRHNPDIKLPEHGPAGDWLVTYDPESSLKKRAETGDNYSCDARSDYTRQSGGLCMLCQKHRVDNQDDLEQDNATGICNPLCGRKFDTPRKEGETDADYYQRMDKLHWGDKTIADTE